MYLVTHSGRVVSREEIIDVVWGNTVVTENTLSRTMAMLRKALGDDSKKPEYIVTRLKKGYQLIAPVSDEPLSSVTEEVQEKNSNEKYKSKPLFLKATYTIGTLMIIVVITYWLKNSKESEFSPQFTKLLPLSHESGIEHSPSFSPNGKLIVYSKKRPNDDNFNLAVYDLTNETHHTITDFEGDEVSASWSPNSGKLAYFSKYKDQCSLYVSSINSTNKISLRKRITGCGYNNQGDIYWLDNRNIIYSDRNIETLGEHKLYKINIDALHATEIPSNYPFSLAINSQKNELATLIKREGNLQFDIQRLNLSTNKIKPWVSNVSPFVEFAWFHKNDALFIAGSYHGKLQFINEHGDIRPILQTNASFFHPSVHPFDDKVTLAQGTMESHIDQYTVSPNTALKSLVLEKDKTEFVVSEFLDYSFKYSTNSEIGAFISNRTGQHQIWLKEGGTEKALQIDQLQKQDITNVQWSFDNQKLLIITTSGEAFVYHMTNKRLHQLNIEKPVYLHHWHSNSQIVYYSQISENGPQLLQYNIESNTETETRFKGVIDSAISPNGRFHFILRLQSGIWLWDQKSQQEIKVVEDVDISALGKLKAFNDGVYWQQHVNQKFSIHHYDLTTGKQSTLYSGAQALSLPLSYYDVAPDQTKLSVQSISDYQSKVMILE
jgi:DNA-binding winged helix-turn-helix (wHTH) protein